MYRAAHPGVQLRVMPLSTANPLDARVVKCWPFMWCMAWKTSSTELADAVPHRSAEQLVGPYLTCISGVESAERVGAS